MTVIKTGPAYKTWPRQHLSDANKVPDYDNAKTANAAQSAVAHTDPEDSAMDWLTKLQASEPTEDPNDVQEDPPLSPLETTLRWGVLAVVVSYIGLLALFKNPAVVFGSLHPLFRDTYKMSFAIATFSALYILRVARNTPKDSPLREKYLLPVRLIFSGTVLWVLALYSTDLFGTDTFYSSTWYVVIARIVTSVGAVLLAFYMRDELMENLIGTGVLYFFLFHVLILDGMVWNVSYILGHETGGKGGTGEEGGEED